MMVQIFMDAVRNHDAMMCSDARGFTFQISWGLAKDVVGTPDSRLVLCANAGGLRMSPVTEGTLLHEPRN